MISMRERIYISKIDGPEVCVLRRSFNGARVWYISTPLATNRRLIFVQMSRLVKMV